MAHVGTQAYPEGSMQLHDMLVRSSILALESIVSTMHVNTSICMDPTVTGEKSLVGSTV